MKRRAFLLAAGALAAPLGVNAQAGRIPRVAAIHYAAVYAPYVEGLRAGLKDLGLREGRDIALEVLDAKGEVKAIEDAARRYEREGVRLIYCTPSSTTAAVKRATTHVPVVFSVGTDPIASGLIESFAKPGGRFTGVHNLSTDLTSKRLELLKELLPKLQQVLVLYNPDNPNARASAGIARQAAKQLGIVLVERHVRSVAELRVALQAIRPGEVDAIFSLSDALVTAEAKLLAETAKAASIPLMGHVEAMAEHGGLASYGVNYHQIGRYAARYVQRVLAGAHPSDLPVENVSGVAFVLNRRTAQAIGLVIPPGMLVRFDRVIE